MSGDHYFSDNPESTLRQSAITLTLRGHNVELSTASGTFSPGSLDTGTAQLLKWAPTPPEGGRFVDLGCGWGALTVALGLESPSASVWGIDVNERALATTAENAATLKLSNVHTCRPEDYPDDAPIDLLWSNPPIRVGKEALHEMLKLWLARLAPAGEAWLVVAKKLGGDTLQAWLNAGHAGDFTAERTETSKGYRILRVRRS